MARTESGNTNPPAVLFVIACLSSVPSVVVLLVVVVVVVIVVVLCIFVGLRRGVRSLVLLLFLHVRRTRAAARRIIHTRFSTALVRYTPR